jgi:hypothetical protein
MNNYDMITSKEYRYLIYLCEELGKVYNSFLCLVEDRDIKLCLVLNEDFGSAYDSAIGEVGNIRLLIDGLDVTTLDSLELDVIGKRVDNIVDYYDYFNHRSTTVVLEDYSLLKVLGNKINN